MSTNTRDDLAQDLNDAVAQAVARLNAGFAHTARDARRAVRDSEAAASRAAREFADDAREVAHDVAEDSRRVARSARRELREHPLAAVAIGAAIGTVFGVLIAQRR